MLPRQESDLGWENDQILEFDSVSSSLKTTKKKAGGAGGVLFRGGKQKALSFVECFPCGRHVSQEVGCGSLGTIPYDK